MIIPEKPHKQLLPMQKKWNEGPIEKMNAIANEAVKVIKENLPAGLKVGELLHDNTLDDNTHKMEGGLSGLMQIIGDAFSTSGNEERDNHLRIF